MGSLNFLPSESQEGIKYHPLPHILIYMQACMFIRIL